jgi:GNAT superfamily N-acetyltransferase
MTDSTCQLITFGPEHLEGAVRLSQQAKWPHRLDDWRMALELSKGLVAVAANGTSIIGTILVTPYKENVATINMVVVDEMARGRGLGRRLLDAAMTLAGSRALRLIATRDGLPLYEKLGFRNTGMIVQYQGHVRTIEASAGARAAKARDIPAIAGIDRMAFGADRESLIRRWAALRCSNGAAG